MEPERTYIARIKDDAERSLEDLEDGGEIMGIPVRIDPQMDPHEIRLVGKSDVNARLREIATMPFPGSRDEEAMRLEATRKRLPYGHDLVKKNGQWYVESGGIIVGKVALDPPKTHERSPLMDALYDCGSLTPRSVNWRIQQEGYGVFTLTCWRGQGFCQVKLTGEQAWKYTRQEWFAAIMDGVNGRQPEGFTNWIIAEVTDEDNVDRHARKHPSGRSRRIGTGRSEGHGNQPDALLSEGDREPRKYR